MQVDAGQAMVLATRGEIVENRHRVSVAVVAPSGRLVAWAGDPDRINPLRSTAKPFQALALLASGAADAAGVTDEELALVCASHVSSASHIALCRQLLAKLDVPEAALGCGGHEPGDDAERLRLLRAGLAPEAIHNNCSGKHAGMLGAARYLGAPLAGYLSDRHPVQLDIARHLRVLADVDAMPHGVDGCSAPTYGLPLHGLARAFARLAAPEAARPSLGEHLERIRNAMQAFPHRVAGEGVIDTDLMRAFPHVVAKRGADGCYAMGITAGRHGPLGVAIKVEDGSGPARTPAIVATLVALHAATPDEAFVRDRLVVDRLNCHGRVVGKLEGRVALIWGNR